MRPASVAVLVTALLVALSSTPTPACGQVYAGEGRAVLGSSMTPADTKKLAFEKARQSALQQFGAHVRSEETLTRVETPDGIREMSTSRIAVLAAGTASLVEGSKEVHRRSTEATIVYEVRAKFRIEPPDFAKTVRAYQRVGSDSRLKRTVATAAKVQEQLTQVDAANAEAPEVRRLLSQAEESYEAISAAVRELDGSELRSKIGKQRRRRKNALLRYMQTVKTHGYPGDLLTLSVHKADVRDHGDEVQFTYEAGYRWTGDRREVTASCRQTRPTWWPDEEGQVSRGWDGWLDQLFDPQSPFSLTLPVGLYLLDEDDNVLLFVNRTSGGMMGSPEMKFTYAKCSKRRLLHTRLWDEEWEFRIPTRYVDRIDGVALVLSTPPYRRIAQQNGFERIGRNLWARAGGRPVSLQRFAFSRKTFEKFVDAYAEKVKSLSSGGS